MKTRKAKNIEKPKGNCNIKIFLSAKKHLILTCGSSFATNLKIETERKVIKEKLLKMQKKTVLTCVIAHFN